MLKTNIKINPILDIYTLFILLLSSPSRTFSYCCDKKEFAGLLTNPGVWLVFLHFLGGNGWVVLLVKRMWRRSSVSWLIREKPLSVRMFGPGCFRELEWGKGTRCSASGRKLCTADWHLTYLLNHHFSREASSTCPATPWPQINHFINK